VKEQSIIEMMRQMEKEMPLSWHIKNIPYKIWSKLWVFFYLSLPNVKYKIIELFCKHEFKSVGNLYAGNYNSQCSKCGKLK